MSTAPHVAAAVVVVVVVVAAVRGARLWLFSLTVQTSGTKRAAAAAAAASSDDDDDAAASSPAPKKAKVASTKKAKAAAAPASPAPVVSNPVNDALQSMTIDQLKNRLKANDQIVGGTKGELISRIRDCIANGCLPRCPSCSGGRMKKIGGMFKCNGFYDDDHFRHCGHSAAVGSIPRPQWQTEAGQVV